MAAASEANRMLSVRSSDGVVFLLTPELCEKSLLLKAFVPASGQNAEPFPMENVDAEEFRKILQWMEHYVDSPAPSADQGQKIELTAFDIQFFGNDKTTVFKLILAANYLHIAGIVDGGTQTIANMMKGLTTEELREKFDVENDFTPEEEAELRAENALADDNDE